MDINLLLMMREANAYASEMLNDDLKEKPLPIELYKLLKSPYVLTSEYGKRIVENLILGAIANYHYQLREILLDSGIDIGEIVLK